MLTGYWSLGRRSGCVWGNTWHWEESFSFCFWNRRQQQSCYCHVLLLIVFIEGTFVRNMIIILWIDYNNAVINVNLWTAARPHFALLNSPVHAKSSLRTLLTIWLCFSKFLGHPCFKVRCGDQYRAELSNTWQCEAVRWAQFGAHWYVLGKHKC